MIDELDFRDWTPVCYTHKLGGGEYECLFTSDNPKLFAIGIYNVYTNSAYPQYAQWIDNLEEFLNNKL